MLHDPLLMFNMIKLKRKDVIPESKCTEIKLNLKSESNLLRFNLGKVRGIKNST